METSELLKKVRKIEIKTRGLSNQIFSGEYHSAFKGRGMAFSEVREYMPGDPIRTIDWNVTARFNHPYVKVFEEERELTVILMVDVSQSGNFGSLNALKKEYIIELSAILSFSAIQNNDKIGVIFFTDKIEKFIPPKKGRTHILRIIRELIEFKPEHTGTNIGEALKYLTSVIKKRSTTFLISDFIDAPERFENALKIANKKHDIVSLILEDNLENQLPKVGLIPMRDNETGKSSWVNTSSKSFRNEFEKKAKVRKLKLQNTLRKSGVDFANINTSESYVKPLMNIFKMRESRK